jgi:hypothetical protein
VEIKHAVAGRGGRVGALGALAQGVEQGGLAEQGVQAGLAC